MHIRSLTEFLPEDPAEVTLVTEAASECDLLKRKIRGFQQPQRQLQPHPQQKDVRRQTDFRDETAGEVTATEPGDFRKLLDGNHILDVLTTVVVNLGERQSRRRNRREEIGFGEQFHQKVVGETT